jgi:hypothetical protein
MAKNTNNARIKVKWIRDKAKSAYQKQSACYICQTTENLELHHTHSITLLVDRWCKQTGHRLDSDEEVLEYRDEFISKHMDEIYKYVYTLCNQHHIRLHQIFGKAPALITATKQSRWIELQRQKYIDGSANIVQPSYGSHFSQFIGDTRGNKTIF